MSGLYGIGVSASDVTTNLQAASAAPKRVRKTIAFDGTAGNGAVGTVALFTTTGRVHVASWTAFATETVVDAGGGTPATLVMGVDGDAAMFGGGALDPADALTANKWWGAGNAVASGGVNGASNYGNGWEVSVNIILSVWNEAISDGTIVFDFWYLPITDDGALVAA